MCWGQVCEGIHVVAGWDLCGGDNTQERERVHPCNVCNKAFKSLTITKGTPGFIHCVFKVASLVTLNKQMLSSLATYDASSLVNHKGRLHLVWLHMVDICTALKNSW